ncbi:hypothetical protein [Streptomyces sp. NPDC046261]|uniref:hypothetical protein n=1 Tax=Streptomyces sp. NPDC046261 TaxID=3157200 RepID=UPI0033F41DB2
MSEAGALPEVLNLNGPGEPIQATQKDTVTLALQYQGDTAVLRAIDGSCVPQHLPVLDTDGNVIANYSVTGVAGEAGPTPRYVMTEHADMLMTAHHLHPDAPADRAIAEPRSR